MKAVIGEVARMKKLKPKHGENVKVHPDVDVVKKAMEKEVNDNVFDYEKKVEKCENKIHDRKITSSSLEHNGEVEIMTDEMNKHKFY